jgi:hypothetical protein
MLTNAICILGVVLSVQGALLSVSGLLADPDRFNGRPVTVSGSLSNLRESVSSRETRRYTFDLSDGIDTVHVISFQKPPCQSGAATVEGTFEQGRRMVKVSYSFEEVTAWNVTCLPTPAPTSE